MRAALYAVIAALIPAVAHADGLGVLKPGDCLPDGVVSNLTLRERWIADKKVPLSTDLAVALTSGRLGGLARSALAACATGDCKPDQKALAELFNEATDVFSADWSGDPDHTLTIDEARAPDRTSQYANQTRAEVFLNGQADWAVIRCTPARLQVALQEPSPKPKPSPFIQHLVIGGAVSDIAASFDKRGFATLGYSNDNAAGSESISADIMVGWKPLAIARRGTFEQIDLAPYVEYERKSADTRDKELNDLTFGASLLGFGRWGGDASYSWTLSGAWQTDDRFNSSLGKAEFGLQPPSLGACSRRSSGTFALRCSGRVVLDYVDVGDAGDKPKLATISEYGRAGLDLETLAAWDIGPNGVVTFRTAYQVRRDVTDADADAELWTVELGLQPSKTSAFNMSLGFTDGEALTSLTATEQFQIKLGFRH